MSKDEQIMTDLLNGTHVVRPLPLAPCVSAAC